MTDRCDAYHDGHDCRRPGACRAALLAMCERIVSRPYDDTERRAIRDLEGAA